MPWVSRPEAERLAERVERRGPDECWPFWGSLRRGYGRLKRAGSNVTVSSHRLTLELKLGRPIRPGMYACHTCDNPACCNPAHLYEGTQQENIADMYERGRGNRPRGEGHPAAKLSDAQTEEIRRRRRAGEPLLSLALEFGVTTSRVSQIGRGVSR